MRAYVYVSDAKVDTYSASLSPHLISKFDLRFKADLPLGDIFPGLPNVGIEGAPHHNGANRFMKVANLCRALEEDGKVGTIYENKPFIRAQMSMTWGFWNRANSGYADVVFWCGYADDTSFVGLGGSAYHTLERKHERIQDRSNSGLQQLMSFLQERADVARTAANLHRDPPGAWYAEGFDADHDNVLIPERFEFVAERLLDDTAGFGVRSIIGSPLYVARTGEPTSRQILKEYENLRAWHIQRIYGRPREKAYLNGGNWQVGKPSSPKPAPAVEPT